ncbi:MAG: PDZ domain-containing protein [Candidatus Omnitrophota bacterium]
MPKKTVIKRRSLFAQGLPLIVFFILALLFMAAILRIGVGEAEWAGLVVSNLDKELAARYDIPPGEKGVCVVIVHEQALNSGIKAGDLLRSINGKTVTSVSSFLKVARYVDIREGVLLDIVRNGGPLYVTLYDRPGLHGKIKRYLGIDPQYTSPVAMRRSLGVAVPAGEAVWLGVELEPGPRGIYVDDVPLGSPAEKAGFKAGDIITAIDGEKVVDMATFNKLTLSGKLVSASVEISRGNSTLYIFIRDELPKGVTQRVAFNLTKPLLGGTGGVGSIVPLLAITPGRAASLPPVEGHWAGVETLKLTPQLALFLNIPLNIKGVLIDEVTMEAQDAGLMAGDVIVKVGGMDTFTLKQFRAATRLVRERNAVDLVVYRKGNYSTFTIRSLWPLGVAQMETAQMIPKGAVAPHRYRGACTSCHTIGNTGQLAKDGGDLLNLNAPPIKRGAKAPHRYRGNCKTCHTIIK